MYTRVIIEDLQVKDNSKSLNNYQKQLELQAEINKSCIKPFSFDNEVYKKTNYEKKELKKFKSLDLSKPNLEIIKAFANSKTPNWGSFIFKTKEILTVLKPV